jgi:energy-coupling factor transporter ATP-binding protein EcfA2
MSIESQDDFAAKVAVNVVTEVFKKAFSGLSAASGWLAGKYREHDPLGSASARYSERFQALYGHVKIFGMHESVPLRRLYVHVNILSQVSAYYQASIKDLEEYLNYDRRSFGCVLERRSALEAVRKHQRLLVLGKPGAGKTTFLKHTALYALEDKLRVKRVPVFVSLKDWSDSNMELLAYITKQFDICAFPQAREFVERLLEMGDALLLFDGLDEVTVDPARAVTDIRDFADKYDNCQYILSCRIAAYNYVFERFVEVEVADFDEKQIARFVANWFAAQPNKGAACSAAIQRDPAIQELASLPLLLALLCLAFDEAMEFSANKAELYTEAVEALLKRWDSTRAISRDVAYQKLTLKEKQTMLSRIAIETFEAEKYFLTRTQLTKQIAEYLDHLPESRKEHGTDADSVLRAIIAQHGLFFERAKGLYSFLHLTFQEYFAARYIVEHQGKRAVDRLLQQCWDVPRWREVILLTAGLLAEADGIVWSLFERAAEHKSEEVALKCETLLRIAPHLDDMAYVDELSERDIGEAWRALTWVTKALQRQSPSKAFFQPSILVMTRIVAFKRKSEVRVTPSAVEATFGLSEDDILEAEHFEKYAYAVGLLRDCLASNIFISKSVRKTAVEEAESWSNLAAVPERIAASTVWVAPSHPDE